MDGGGIWFGSGVIFGLALGALTGKRDIRKKVNKKLFQLIAEKQLEVRDHQGRVIDPEALYKKLELE